MASNPYLKKPNVNPHSRLMVKNLPPQFLPGCFFMRICVLSGEVRMKCGMSYGCTLTGLSILMSMEMVGAPNGSYSQLSSTITLILIMCTPWLTCMGGTWLNNPNFHGVTQVLFITSFVSPAICQACCRPGTTLTAAESIAFMKAAIVELHEGGKFLRGGVDEMVYLQIWFLCRSVVPILIISPRVTQIISPMVL